ncbi:MAG: hypothetical protein IKT33_01525 [Clostridia bacterium]|nr:hypothetical protein [Clostridia bacterium]
MEFNQKIIERLSKHSDKELIELFTEQIKLKKQNGTLGDLEKLIKIISPMLNEDQRTRLAKIIQTIKNQK